MRDRICRTLVGVIAAALLAVRPAAGQEPVKPAERTSFREVTKNLDAGGDVYAYLSMETVAKTLDEVIDALEPILKETVERGAPDPKKREQGAAAIGMLRKAYEQSGVREISGIGFSSIAVEKGVYRSKAFLHHYPGKDSGKLWGMFGKKPHKLTGLDFLPTTTAMAVFYDLDLNLLWDWQESLFLQSGSPSLVVDYKSVLDKIARIIDLKKTIRSTDGEVGLIITLNPNRTVTLPAGDQVIQFPEPGLVVAIKMKDDSLMKFVEAKCRQHQLPVMKQQVQQLDTLTIPLQLPLPVDIKPTFAMVDGYFLLANNSALMQQVIAVKKGEAKGLTSTAEFTRISKGMPQTGNMFGYVSPRFGKTIARIQESALKGANPNQQKVMGRIYKLQKMDEMFSYGVGRVLPDGLYSVGNANVSGSQALVTQAAVLPAALLLGMALPAMEKAQAKAKRVNAASNLKQIGLACIMYAGDNNGDFPAPDGPEGLNQLVKQDIVPLGKLFIHPNDKQRAVDPQAKALTAKNCSYVYIGAGYKDDDREATKTPLAFDRPGIDKNFVNVLFLDGHVEGFEGKFQTSVDVIEMVHKMKQLSDRRYKSLLSKAKRLDH